MHCIYQITVVYEIFKSFIISLTTDVYETQIPLYRYTRKQKIRGTEGTLPIVKKKLIFEISMEGYKHHEIYIYIYKLMVLISIMAAMIIITSDIPA